MHNDNKKDPSGYGANTLVVGGLGILFVGLKLTGHIDWPWIWVVSPFWIPIVLVIGILALAGIMIGFAHFLDTWDKDKK